MNRFVHALSRVFHPFASIARSLEIIAELYEAELGARTDTQGRPSPIRRITEQPSPRDTEVTYMGVEPDKRSRDFAWDADEEDDG